MPITLANLRARVLERADMVNSSFMSTAELNAIINGEGAELHDLVVSRYEDYFTTSVSFSILTGNTYAFATTFYKLRGLDMVDGSGAWANVARDAWENRGLRTGDRAYRIVGSSLFITPDNDAAGNYRLWYVPAYVDLVADADLLDFPQNWHEYVIAGAAAKCLSKEESDPSVQFALKAQTRERILSMGVNRDASASECVQQTRRAWDEDEY